MGTPNHFKANDRPEIDLVPLSQFSSRYARGWRMVPGYPLNPGDYAVTMMPPGWKEPVRSNNQRSASHAGKIRNEKRWSKVRALENA